MDHDGGTLEYRELMLSKFKMWKKDPVKTLPASPIIHEDGSFNLYEWRCSMPGPGGSPFEMGHFLVHLLFPRRPNENELYILFLPPIFHPNVDEGGLMRTPFSPFWRNMSMRDILTRIYEQMALPCLHFALDNEATDIFNINYEMYCNKVRAEVVLRNNLDSE